jgi:hypothetical protein
LEAVLGTLDAVDSGEFDAAIEGASQAGSSQLTINCFS